MADVYKSKVSLPTHILLLVDDREFEILEGGCFAVVPLVRSPPVASSAAVQMILCDLQQKGHIDV